MLAVLFLTWITRQINPWSKKGKKSSKTHDTLCQLASLFLYAHCLSDIACLRTTLILTVQYKQWNICSTLCCDDKHILLWYCSVLL